MSITIKASYDEMHAIRFISVVNNKRKDCVYDEKLVAICPHHTVSHWHIPTMSGRTDNDFMCLAFPGRSCLCLYRLVHPCHPLSFLCRFLHTQFLLLSLFFCLHC